jgi:hypothetical protein
MRLAAVLLAMMAPSLICAGDTIRLKRDSHGRVVATNTRGGAYAGSGPAVTAEPPAARPAPASEPDHLEGLIRQAAKRHGVSPALVSAVVAVESGFNPRAVSPKGARGLMQLMPATAAELAVDNVYDPAQNLEGGTRHLRGLMDRFDGDLRLALAAYNAGADAVKRHGGVPPYPETRDYVRKVLERMPAAGDPSVDRQRLRPYRDVRGHLVLSNVPLVPAQRSRNE